MSGSSPPDRVEVGRVIGPFGLHGELKVDAGDPADLRVGLSLSALLRDGSQRALVIEAMRPHKNRVLVRFEGIRTVDEAAILRGCAIRALRADLPPLPDRTYRVDDLIGMTVTDARLGNLGEVRRVEHYPRSDMLVVGERAMLVPMLAAYAVVIDPQARRISTSLPDGFEDL